MSTIEEFRRSANGSPPRRAPYAFVKAPRKVLPSPTTDLDLSRPVENAISGSIEIEWTAETPLLVGGGDATMDQSSRDSDDQARPFRIGSDYMIPGSTLKGLIRSNLEIATCARLSFIGNHTAHIRDFNHPEWRKVAPDLRNGIPEGGWLFKSNDGYRLISAEQVVPVQINQIVAELSATSVADWHIWTMHQRQQKLRESGLGGLRSLNALGVPRTGQLAIAGITADTDRQKKQREYIFVWPENVQFYSISEAIGDRFIASLHRDSAAHGGAPESNFDGLTQTGRIDRFCADTSFEEQMSEPGRHGLPVFWSNSGQKTPGSNPILSLTAFFRFASQYTLEEITERSQEPMDPDQLDFVQALLGWAPEKTPKARPANRKETERSWKSRIKFGFAKSENATPETQTRRWAATKPSASFWPFYLKPKDGAGQENPYDYQNPDSVVAGRKRYPVRSATSQLPGAENRPEGDRRDAREQDLNFLRPGATFTGKIRISNVTEIELGALIWAINFGDVKGEKPYRHMLGRAKSFGFGEVRAKIVGADLYRVKDVTNVNYEALPQKFTNWLSERMGQPFDQIEHIRQLRAMADSTLGKEIGELLTFAKTGIAETEGQKTLNAYVKLKQNATKAGSTPIEVGLPDYPDSLENDV